MALERHKDDRNSGALFIPAGIFLGLGYGFYTHNIPGGLFVGLGLGFVGFAITSIIMSACCCKK